MDKEIVIEPAELTAEEQRKAEEAKKAFGKILKKAFKRAPVRSCGKKVLKKTTTLKNNSGVL